MPSFSKRSQDALATCHFDLQRILEEAIKITDFTVLCGHRDKVAQMEACKTGRSKLEWPKSRHNSVPSQAVDIAPSPLNWSDRERFVYLAGVVKAVAHSLGIKLRWGGDWNENGVFSDEAFSDLPHFELLDRSFRELSNK